MKGIHSAHPGSWSVPASPASTDKMSAAGSSVLGSPAADDAEAGLALVLQQAGLGHYLGILQLHGATLEGLKALQPNELSRFGIHTPGAQDRLAQALKAY
eukprot:scaffold668463_cov106-Prasinocladus_malaysianus.AAC.1